MGLIIGWISGDLKITITVTPDLSDIVRHEVQRWPSWTLSKMVLHVLYCIMMKIIHCVGAGWTQAFSRNLWYLPHGVEILAVIISEQFIHQTDNTLLTPLLLQQLLQEVTIIQQWRHRIIWWRHVVVSHPSPLQQSEGYDHEDYFNLFLRSVVTCSGMER